MNTLVVMSSRSVVCFYFLPSKKVNECKDCIDKLIDRNYSENILIFEKRLHLSSGVNSF